jgi:C4-dicarboxylate-specific signal transduction histidine kinase
MRDKIAVTPNTHQMHEEASQVPSVRRGITPYAIAIASVGTALVVARLLDAYLVTAPVSLFLSAIMLSGWFGGFSGGLTSAMLSIVAFAYYFVSPLNSFAIAANEVPRTLIYEFSAVFVGWLSAAQRSTTESLRHARDQLSTTVQELTRANEALKAEDLERTRTTEALRQSQADLARASRATVMGELTATLAHEVNQPIAAAVINANSCVRWLAGDTPNVEEARAAANRIVQDGTRASEIITRVSRLFKKGPMEHEPVDVNGVIREIMVILQSEATQNSVVVHDELAPDLPEVNGDRVQLQQVMMNLIMNGIDAMKNVDGPRDLTITSRRGDNDQLLVSVSDSGIGLPAKAAEIFNAFFTTKPGGIGMGLSISRSIIESHGGHLWASGNAPHGAQFYFTLPGIHHGRTTIRLYD